MEKNLLNEKTADSKITQVAFHLSQNNRTNRNTPQKPDRGLQNSLTTPSQPVSLAWQADLTSHHLKNGSFQVSVLRPANIDSNKGTGFNSDKNNENLMASLPGSLKVEVKDSGLSPEKYSQDPSAALTPVQDRKSVV